MLLEYCELGPMRDWLVEHRNKVNDELITEFCKLVQGIAKGMECLAIKGVRKLPPLNFTATCSVYGRYVIYYNERLDIVTYPPGYELFEVSTEICEFIVQGETVKFDIIKYYKIL